MRRGPKAWSTVSLYFVRVTPSTGVWDLRKKLNGAGSISMRTFTVSVAAGDSIGRNLNGSTITAYHESGGSWAAAGSVTDTSITAGGYLTFSLGDTTARGGAFGGGNAG